MKKRTIAVLMVFVLLVAALACFTYAEDAPLEGEQGVEPRYDPATCPHANKQSYPETAPTGTTVGYTAGVFCNHCQTWVSGHEEIPAIFILGDVDGDGVINTRDAIRLLYHVYFPMKYEVSQDCDFNGDGAVNAQDAIHLLYHVYFPEKYKLD